MNKIRLSSELDEAEVRERPLEHVPCACRCACVHLRVFVCMCVCVRARACVCVWFVCLCVHLCKCVCACACACVNACAVVRHFGLRVYMRPCVHDCARRSILAPRRRELDAARIPDEALGIDGGARVTPEHGREPVEVDAK